VKHEGSALERALRLRDIRGGLGELGSNVFVVRREDASAPLGDDIGVVGRDDSAVPDDALGFGSVWCREFCSFNKCGPEGFSFKALDFLDVRGYRGVREGCSYGW
jgi:hypothetical protein